ncbi:MAG: HRDC domain-containing protein [Prevotellaceae bacterium]|jgi:hypothetical protein|nr:HRDC domain-containing protein [Prevotellaceae bacterium]
MQTNPQLELATKFVQYTGQHIFLTGKAGTGKTTFLHSLRETAAKRMIVVAPTGVAAINARGVTIHSFFQLPPRLQIGIEQMNPNQMRFSKEKINIIRSLDLLVIDEISMVRADLLDAVDFVMRRFRSQNKPFGGAQLLMIGDLQQLSPIVKDDEREYLLNRYETPYFFSSKALHETSFISIELTHVFRQHDDSFISILNKVRENNLDKAALDALNQRYIPNFTPKDDDGYITLCTHNAQAQRINETKLNALRDKGHRFTAQVQGTFPEYAYPTEFELTLKENAQVMFVKNDTSAEKQYYNGKIGKITYLRDGEIRVRCPNEANEIIVTPQKWENVKYSLNAATHEIQEDVEGSFEQIPLKLAWAITIHKSQGLTFEHAVIDAEASFAHGQVYVALSRCKTMEGMVLSSPIRQHSIINDQTVSGFTQQIEKNLPDENQFQSARTAYQHEQLADLFHFDIFRSRVAYIAKINREHSGSVLTATQELFHRMLSSVQADLIEVADRFHRQMNQLLMQQPDAEQNTALQSRIRQASAYFSEKIKTLILDPLGSVDLDLDNKAVKKQLTDVAAHLENDARLKYDSLCACLSGFDLSKFLHAKAIAAIQKEKVKTKEKTKETPRENRNSPAVESTDIAHPVLFQQLRSWRMEKATELNMPPYIIFSQKALYELIQYMPTNRKSLLQINGIGQVKFEKFGADIIEIIRKYCDENGVEKVEIPFKESPFPKTPKGDTRLVSLNLFKAGKTIAEIAAERQLSTNTIEGHLASYVSQGNLDAKLLIAQDKLDTIVRYFRETDNRYSLSEAKNTLGDDVSYSELRIGLAHFWFLFK